MAIAVSPPAARPPSDRVSGSRKVAMPLPFPVPGPAIDVEHDGHCSPDELWTIAESLVPCAVSWPGMSRPSRRRWALIGRSPTVEAWVVAWPPGGAIELHDHGVSAGAVVVAAGALVETSIVERDWGVVDQRTRTLTAGRSIRFTPGHIHDMVNTGTDPALSVHVYSPPLTFMTHYRVTGAVLEAGATVRYLWGEAP